MSRQLESHLYKMNKWNGKRGSYRAILLSILLAGPISPLSSSTMSPDDGTRLYWNEESL